MAKKGNLLAKLYGVVAFGLMAVGFIGLFSQKLGWRIPILSTHILPALHRHAVWGETLRGRAILLGGGEWFFLIMVGLVIFAGLFTAILHKLIKSIDLK